MQPSDADDVSQDVLRTTFEKIDQFKKTGSFRGWLWTITRNKIMDFYRRQKQTPVGDGGTDHAMKIASQPDGNFPDFDTSEVDLFTASSTGSEFDRALDFLRKEVEESTLKAFVRMAIDGLSALEVATELGWVGETKADAANAAKRVRMCKVRVLKKLREEFGDLVQFPN